MNRSLSPERWRTLEPLIDEALALPVEQRAAFIDAACGGDAAMRDELSTMLIACERLAGDDAFLGQPAGERYASLWDDPAADERLADALGGRYVLEGEAGRGGMAVVYRAQDVVRQRWVALKVLRPTVGERGATRFRREIELAKRLQHPGIVSVLDAGESTGRLWYTMPLVDGETLGARLRRVAQLEIADVVRFMRTIADALSYAHTYGVIHRDLKPDNILLEGDRAIVADFGVAKALVLATDNGAIDAVDEHATTAGVRVGTPLYMAPEQIAGEAVVDHRVDLYALGVIAYQLVAGRPPFGATSRQALVAAHLAEEPPPLASYRDGVPPELERLVMRLLAKRASDRPASAADVRAELDAMLPSIAVPAGVRRTILEASMSDDASSARTGDNPSPRASDDLPTLDVIAGRYRIEQRIAAGGMATVFVAQDLKHGRRVAVKVLHESLAHTIGIQRFLREIEVIARLQHPHLLTLIDSGDVEGLPYYVMPYLEAQSLRETITAQKRLSFEDAIRITKEVADGLAYAHGNGVVHRDIKPANILMSGGHAVVADFGIATALQRAGAGRLTGTGMSLGSPTYMSPEQAAGEHDVDERSDIYSLACVLYEMLAGEPPIDSASMQEVVTRKLTDRFTKLHERRTDVPPLLEAAIHRAMSADRKARFSSIEEFSQAISLPTVAPRASRSALWIGIAAGVVAIIGGGLWLRRERAIVRATQQVALVDQLAMGGKSVSAFELAEQILRVIPNDSTLRKIRPAFSDFLKIVTVPSGARVSLQRIDRPDSTWRFVGETPLDSLAVARAGNGINYKVRIERVGFEPREILGNLFLDLSQAGGPPRPIDTLRLDSLGAHAGMVRITGPARGNTPFADYYVAKTEVTNREYARFVAGGGYTKREYWAEPMQKDGRPVAWEQAMPEFRDRSGSAGTSTWINGTYPTGQADFPVGGVSYYEAAAYARFSGLSLPTNAHWRRAATFSLREMSWAYMPTSNLNNAQPRRVGDGAINPWGLYDVAGNVREWCVNPAGNGRLALGGGWEDAEWLTANTLWRPEFDRSPSNGFRLVSLPASDSAAIAVLSKRVTLPFTRDFRGFKAVSDAEFAGYRRMFDYDRRPLDVRIEAEGVSERLRWQRVSFTAAYGGERMMAYVYLPKNAAPPFEPVILWPPGPPSLITPEFVRGVIFANMTGFIPQNGRALILPVFRGNFERDASRFTTREMTTDTTMSYRDFVVQWVNDMRRTIDYIETRPDMRADRVGYFGVSWGGQTAPIALAIEPRIKAAVLNSAGYDIRRPTRPEVDAGNYAPRVHVPILMLSGAHDNAIFPYETSQAPFLQQLGTPAADKKRVAYSASHLLPQEDVIRETLAWFDQYLSGRASPPSQVGARR